VIDFELVVPDGWVVLPTTPTTTRLRAWAIDTVVGHFLPDSLPRDTAEPWRRELRKELVAATDEASAQGARSVLLPLEKFNGLRVPGSMLMTVLEDGASTDPEQLLASILSDAGPDGTYLEIGGAPSVRVAGVQESGRIGRSAPSRRVSYYVSNPDAPGVWGLLTFTVLTDGDLEAEEVQAIVLLFDMVASTLRWADRENVPTEDELLAMVAAVAAVPPVRG
jgi:hypothetical protein